MSGEAWFLFDPLPGEDVDRTTLRGPEGRHAATVVRLRPGESIVLTDGRGGTRPATVAGVGRGEVDLVLGAPVAVPAPRLRVVVVQALPKGERGELAVDLATEAGADGIVPWAAERCVVRWNRERADRGLAKWRSTVAGAGKQARRAWHPPVAELADTAAVARRLAAADLAMVLHEDADRTLRDFPLPPAGEVVLVVGPEGGVSPGELATFRTAGAVPVRLGPEVLRTSTAAAVALGALGVLTDRWELHRS